MPQLHKVKKRTLADIEHWPSAREILRIIMGKQWPYKTNREFYWTRDKALLALLFVTGGRNNEVISLRKRQFEETDDFLLVKEMKVSKRTKRVLKRYGPKVSLRDPIRLPKYSHTLQPFTYLVIDYLRLLDKPKQKLFRFGTRRCHQIVTYITGKWPHWFRAMSENYYGKLFNNPLLLAKFIKVTDIQSVMPYVKIE